MADIPLKNVAISSPEEIVLDEGFFLIIHEMKNKGPHSYHKDLDRTHIQFHFCLEGKVKLMFNEGRYELPLNSEQSLLLYNTLHDLPINMHFEGRCKLVSLIMTIRKFHTFFSSEAQYISFLQPQNRDKKYYAQEGISPTIGIILSQIVNQNLHPSVRQLFLKGKAYELLANYFNRSEDATLAQCPYLEDEDEVQKIRRAKDIVISQMSEPPGLEELAKEVGLSLKKLKSGFKQVYGTSVYGFLWDYKMEFARKLLETTEYSVNDVALRVGYSTASHFIAAFKKRYHTTPKKYLMSLQD